MFWRQPSSCFVRARVVGAALAMLMTIGPACGAEAVVPTQVPVAALPASPGWAVSEEERAAELYAVILDREVIADAIPAYPTPSGLRFPVGELCRIFEIEVNVNMQTGTLQGRLPSGGSFSVDAGRLVMNSGGVDTAIGKDRLKLAEGDFFLDVSLVSRLLPVDLAVNGNELTLTVTPRLPLPLQERTARENLWDTLRRRSEHSPNYPPMAVPYRFFGGPFLDQTVQLIFDPPSTGGSSQFRADYTTHITSDLLWASFDGYLSGTNNSVSDIRGTLGRKDPAARLLGPLHATEAGVGNVFSSGLELVMAPASGTGIVVSNFPVQRTAFFDRTALRGNLPDGWSVELYLNGNLLAYQGSRPDGLYEFLDVPVYFGLNIYRLVFYGPSGQRREETRTFSATETLTPTGTFRYSAGAFDPSLRFVDTLPLNNGKRSWIEGEYGLSRGVALSAAVARSAFAQGDARSYATAGMRASLGPIFFRGDLAFSRDGGRAFQIGAQARLGGVGILVQHAELSNYITDWFQSVGENVSRRSYLRLDGAIPKGFLPQLPLSLQAERAERTDGSSILRLNGRLSAYIGGVSASNVITWWHDQGTGGAFDLITGNLLLSRNISTLAIRGGLSYSLRPTRLIQSGSLSIERRFRNSFMAAANLTRSFQDRSTNLALGLTRNEGIIGYGLQAQYSHPGGVRVVAQLSIGLGRDDEGKWHASARQMATSGALVGRTFLDTNANGSLDHADTPLDQVRFLVNGGRTIGATDQRGSVFIPGVAPYQATPVSVATETLEDPFWKPSIEGVTIVPRPGRAPMVTIPVLVTGEVTGSAFVKHGEKQHPAANAKVELLDSAGKVAKSTTSAWDGYFTLTEVRPGKYTLCIAAESLQKLGAVSATTRTLEIGNDGTVLDGLDLVIAAGNEVTNTEEVPTLATPNSLVNPVVTDQLVTPLEAEQVKTTRTLPSPSPSANQPTPPAPTPAVLRPEKPTPICSVQIAAYRERQNAVADAEERAIELHQPSRVVEVELANEGRWYRVLLGRFASESDARDFRTHLASVNKLQVGPVSCESTDGTPQTATPATSTRATQSPIYAIQLAAYRDRQGAVNFAALMTSWLGHPSHIAEVRLGAGGMWYRVLVGDFNSARDAASFRTYLVNDKKLEVGPILLLPPHS